MILVTFLTFLMLILLGGGLWLAKSANERQDQERKTKARIRKMRQISVDIEDVFNTLREFDDNFDLQRLLANYMVNENKKRLHLDENNTQSIRDLEHSKTLLEELLAAEAQGADFTTDANATTDMTSPPPPPSDTDADKETENSADSADTETAKAADPEQEVQSPHAPKRKKKKIPKNDRQISQIRRHCSKAIKLLSHMVSQNLITRAEADEHSQKLRMLALQSEVKAYLLQGQVSKAKEDYMMAASYYKHAKELLVSSPLTYEDKTKQIKNISKMIAGLYTTVNQKENTLLDESEEDFSSSLDSHGQKNGF